MNDSRSDEPHAVPEYWDRFESLGAALVRSASRAQLDGDRVYLYESGLSDASPVILVSPSESPFLLMSGLFRRLSEQFRVLAWDSTRAVFMEAGLEEPPPTLEQMSGHLVQLASRAEGRKPHLVTWCSGALIALWAIARAPSAFASVTLIAPSSILSTCSERTAFQSQFLHLILELARGTRADDAQLCEQILALPKQRPILNETDRLVAGLTGLTMRHEVALRRYARSIQNACLVLPETHRTLRDRAYVQLVCEAARAMPVSIIHCRDDDVVSYRCSRDVAVANDGVRLVEYPKGGHFVIFTRPHELAWDIGTFVRGTERGEIAA